VLLLGWLDGSLRRLNPDLPDDAIRAALNKVRDTEFAGDLMSENRHIHEVLGGGVPVSWFEGDTERSDIARLVDWRNRENVWLTVNQFEVVGQTHGVPVPTSSFS